MAKVIVAGTDGTEGASKALVTAATMADALGAQLVVINAVDKFEMEKIGPPGDETLISSGEEGEKIAAQGARMLKQQFPDLDVVSRVAQGKPADALVAVAEELDADLIVVGNKRVQSVARVLGAIATDVAHHAPCDVYIAHTQS